MRRLALVATPIAESDPHGIHGSLDGDAIRIRLAQEDAGFEVIDLDPSRDLAEQLDEVFDSLGDAEVDALFYTSSPVVLAPDGELFICLDPREIETGDALDEIATVFIDRARGRRLFVLDSRYPSTPDPLLGISCMESIKARLRGRAEVLAAARPSDQAQAGAVSPLTRAVLRALDDEEPGQPLTTKRVHERIVEEAHVAGEVRALAYLSHVSSMPLLPGAAPPSEEAAPAATAAVAASSTGGAATPWSHPHSGPVSAPGATPISLPPGARTDPPRGDLGHSIRPSSEPHGRTLSLRVGDEALTRAARHVEAAVDLARAGLGAAALDELRRASLVAPPAARASIARERARVSSKLGGDAAIAAIDEALALVPDDAEMLGLRARALGSSDDEEARRAAEERWLEAVGEDGPARAAALVELGRRAAARGDDARAVVLLERAAAADDVDGSVLVELRALANHAGDRRGVGRWTRRLAERATSPRARARLLREAAAVLEAGGHPDDAAGCLEAALEADPTQLGALDALTRLLAPAERWSYVAALVRRLASRCEEVTPASVAIAARSAILGRLGGLLRDRCGDPAGALAAFEAALAENPRDPSMHLAALLVAIDSGDARAALDHVAAAARAGHLDLALTQRLGGVLAEDRRTAAVERAAIVAEALGATDEPTLAAAAAARIPGSPSRPLGPAGRAAWMGDEIEPAIDAFLDVVTPAAAAARLEQLARTGGVFDVAGAALAPADGAVARAVLSAARVLGVAPPRVHVVATGRLPLEVPIAGEPVIVASQDATDGLPPRELAFLAGRAVASLSGNHVLARLYPAPDDLDALVLGAAAAAAPDVTIDPRWADAAATRRSELEPWLGEEDLAGLATVTHALVAADLPLDGAAWLLAVRRRLDRAGLLVAGDVLAAVSVVAREEGDGQRLDDLLGFYLSSAYEAVLGEVGGSMVPPPPDGTGPTPGPSAAPAETDQGSRIEG